MFWFQCWEYGCQWYEGGDKDFEGDGGDQCYCKVMVKVLRNVVKCQVGECYFDVVELVYYFYLVQFFFEDFLQYVRENGGEEEDCLYLELF